MTEIEITQIKIGDRFRKDVGDIESLAENIMDVGLLHPIVLNEDNELIAGYRRIKAYEYLLKTKIPCTVVDLEDIRKGEVSENKERKDFTTSEVKAIYDYLKPKIGKIQGQRTDLTSGNLPEVGRTRDIIADYVGVSGKTLDKIIFIEEEGTEKERELANSADRQISHAYNKVKKRKKPRAKTPPLPEGLYNIILADPPWEYNFSETDSRSIPTHYPDMDLQDICDMEIPSAEDSILFLWATNPKLEEALQVLNSWGFTYKTNMVWVKNRIITGYWFRGQHELLLVGTKGKFPTPEPSVRRSGVLNAPIRGHSEKPEEVYEIIESYFPDGKYLELFSRRLYPIPMGYQP